jgi:hypothetical protein
MVSSKFHNTHVCSHVWAAKLRHGPRAMGRYKVNEDIPSTCTSTLEDSQLPALQNIARPTTGFEIVPGTTADILPNVPVPGSRDYSSTNYRYIGCLMTHDS